MIMEENDELSHGLSGLFRKGVYTRNYIKMSQGNPMPCSLKITHFVVLNCMYPHTQQKFDASGPWLNS